MLAACAPDAPASLHARPVTRSSLTLGRAAAFGIIASVLNIYEIAKHVMRHSRAAREQASSHELPERFPTAPDPAGQAPRGVIVQ